MGKRSKEEQEERLSIYEAKRMLESLNLPNDLVVSSDFRSKEVIDIVKRALTKSIVKETGEYFIQKTDSNLNIIRQLDPRVGRCVFTDYSGQPYHSGNYKEFTDSDSDKKIPSEAKLKKGNQHFENIIFDTYDYLEENYGRGWGFTKVATFMKSLPKINRVNLMRRYREYIMNNYNDRNSSTPLAQAMLEILTKHFFIYYTGNDTQATDMYVFYAFHQFFTKWSRMNVLADLDRVDARYPADESPVLIEAEGGYNKTWFIGYMMGDDKRFFDSIDPEMLKGTKDDIQVMTGLLLAELSEIGGSNFKNAEPIKRAMSNVTYKARFAYGSSVETYDRRWGVIGSSNRTEDLLRDRTGNRRWWPIEIRFIDKEKLVETKLNCQTLSFYFSRAEWEIRGAIKKGNLKPFLCESLYPFAAKLYNEYHGTDHTSEYFQRCVESEAKRLRSDNTARPSFYGNIEKIIDCYKDEYAFITNLLVDCLHKYYKDKGLPLIREKDGHIRNQVLDCFRVKGLESTSPTTWDNYKQARAYRIGKAVKILRPEDLNSDVVDASEINSHMAPENFYPTDEDDNEADIPF